MTGLACSWLVRGASWDGGDVGGRGVRLEAFELALRAILMDVIQLVSELAESSTMLALMLALIGGGHRRLCIVAVQADVAPPPD